MLGGVVKHPLHHAVVAARHEKPILRGTATGPTANPCRGGEHQGGTWPKEAGGCTGLNPWCELESLPGNCLALRLGPEIKKAGRNFPPGFVLKLSSFSTHYPGCFICRCLIGKMPFPLGSVVSSTDFKQCLFVRLSITTHILPGHLD